MEPANHLQAEACSDLTARIHGEEHRGEIAGVSLKGVLAIEDGQTFVIGTP